jgi:chaperonin GroEL
MKNKILYNKDAQKAFKKGVDLVANTVKVTLGKKGRNVMCVRDGMLPVITKDGVSVAREVQHSDPIINAGAMAVKQVAVKTAEDAGDGTTSSSVLAQAIIEFAQDALETTNAITIKNGIDAATVEVVKHLKNFSQKTKSIKRIKEIAEISANGDKEISKLVVEAIQKVGQFGVIKIEEVESLAVHLILGLG